MASSNDLDQWMKFSQDLRPFQGFALIGLLELKPTLTPDTIDKEKIVGEEKCLAASQWASKYFREALQIYCKNQNNLSIQIGSPALKELIPLFITTAGLVTGGAVVGFLVGALGVLTSQWCKNYGRKEFIGHGQYLIDEDSGNVSSPPTKTISGLFNISYNPPIVETIRDTTPRGMLDHKIEVSVPAKFTGRFDPEDNSAVQTIYQHFQKARHPEHSFNFQDKGINKLIKGSICKGPVTEELISNKSITSVTQYSVILKFEEEGCEINS